MIKKLAVAMLFVAPTVAFSATYSVTEQSGVTTMGAKLTELGKTGCVYGDVQIALGDILTYPSGLHQVCASGQNGPRLLDVADPGKGILLSADGLEAGNAAVQLSKWKRPDGHICQEYVSSTKTRVTDTGTKTDITKGLYCDDKASS